MAEYTSVILDGIPLNSSDPQSAYAMREPIDWGSRAIQDVLLDGNTLPEDYDSVIASTRLLRQVTFNLRVTGTNSDEVLTRLRALQNRLSRASRINPIDLTITPKDGYNQTTLKVVGGTLDDTNAHTRKFELANVYEAPLILQTLPFFYGLKQVFGSRVDSTIVTPFDDAAGLPPPPLMLPITPVFGREGDAPADLNVFVAPVSGATAPFRNVIVGAGWPDNQSAWATLLTMSDNFSAIASNVNFVTPRDALSIDCIQFSPPDTNTIHSVCETNIGPGVFQLVPGVPYRFFLRVNDGATVGSGRGVQQFRLRLKCGNTIAFSEWFVVPADSGPTINALHVLNGYWCLIDMGAWTIPLAPLGDVRNAVTSITIQQQTPTSQSTGLIYDYMMAVPDLTSMIAETTDVLANPGSYVKFESENVYDPNGAPLSIATGANIRMLGPGAITVHASRQPMAPSMDTGDFSFESAAVWVEYIPRYFNPA